MLCLQRISPYPTLGSLQTIIYNPLRVGIPASVPVPPVMAPTPKLPVSILPARLEEEHPPQMLTVTLRPTGDPQHDIRRISRLHGTFISYPGKDHFAFQIFKEGRGHLINSPTTPRTCAPNC